MFGVDQSSINRSPEASGRVLSEVPPAARKTAQLIKGSGRAGESDEDNSPGPRRREGRRRAGRHAPVDRSSDKDRRRADYSGKKTFACANVLTDAGKRILWIGEKAPGGTHDLTLPKGDPPDPGTLARIASKYDTPEPDRPALHVDKGCRAYPDTVPAPPYGSRPNAPPTPTGRPGGRQKGSPPSTRRSTARGWSSGTPSG